MKQFTYWLTHYIHFYSLHVISSAVFLIVGWGARLDMFRETEIGVLLVCFFMWGHGEFLHVHENVEFGIKQTDSCCD